MNPLPSAPNPCYFRAAATSTEVDVRDGEGGTDKSARASGTLFSARLLDGPQYRPLYITILIIGTPKVVSFWEILNPELCTHPYSPCKPFKSIPNFGKRPFSTQCEEFNLERNTDT